MTRFATIALVVLSTAVAGVAVAGQGPGRLVEALDLNTEQAALVESFKDEMQESRADAKEAQKAFRDAMKEEIASGDPDVRKLKKLVDAKVEAQRAAAYTAVESMSELSAMLTDEQLPSAEGLGERPVCRSPFTVLHTCLEPFGPTERCRSMEGLG
jgi:Spy/CpxP family protein refolding chaperone